MATPDHKARKHADLPPSSAYMWMNCHGWRATVAQHVDMYGKPPSSKAADEGTAAHEKMEAHLLVSLRDRLHPDFVTDTTPRELTEEDDEFDDLMTVVEWVEAQPGLFFLEHRVDCGAPFGFVDQEGTVDITILEPRRLTIADLKFGRVPVNVVDEFGRYNAQLMDYLVGAVHKHGPRDFYRLVILQPRAFHKDGPIREVIVPHAALEVFKFELEEAMEANFKGGECTPGPWCRPYCPALGSCRAVAARALRIFAENPLE